MRFVASQDEPFELDDVDRRIISILKTDGRASNKEIAKKLRIVAATVSARIRRLQQANVVRVIAVTDFAAVGYKVLIALGLEVQGRPAEQVANELAACPEVFATHVVSCARDIECLVALKDFDDIGGFMDNTMSRIRGIRTIEAGIAHDVLKYNFDIAQIYG
jgi:Lrp/AsnC family transcriptional regulator for asnA, asnC and gidA